jgi:hypothetical protein
MYFYPLTIWPYGIILYSRSLDISLMKKSKNGINCTELAVDDYVYRCDIFKKHINQSTSGTTAVRPH